MEEGTRPALVATLGLQPQVITRALDELLRMAPDLATVTIVHTSTFSRSHPHWKSLPGFKQYVGRTYPAIRWLWVPIKDSDGWTVADVETPDNAELAFKTIFAEIKRIKRQRQRLHGLIAGGRKSMIVYTMVSAQLLFDAEDQLWHLFSTLESQEPHITDEAKDESKLVEIPVMHLAGLMPMVRELILNSDDPTLAIRLYRRHEDVERVVRLRSFYESRDSIDQRILRLAYRGWSNRQIGDEVGLSESRVNTRLSKLADRFYVSFGWRTGPRPKHIRRRLLIDLRPLFLTFEAEA